mmetsp:Transcript_5838/g.16598  ORF Transcript_5838/g.16598 Transcript_5838/m.16598 type:complete len:231 (-) Transcript_5838:255-947(-)
MGGSVLSSVTTSLRDSTGSMPSAVAWRWVTSLSYASRILGMNVVFTASTISRSLLSMASRSLPTSAEMLPADALILASRPASLSEIFWIAMRAWLSGAIADAKASSTVWDRWRKPEALRTFSSDAPDTSRARTRGSYDASAASSVSLAASSNVLSWGDDCMCARNPSTASWTVLFRASAWVRICCRPARTAVTIMLIAVFVAFVAWPIAPSIVLFTSSAALLADSAASFA